MFDHMKISTGQTYWSSGAGDYKAQQQLDYKLTDGQLTRVVNQSKESKPKKEKDNWTGAT